MFRYMPGLFVSLFATAIFAADPSPLSQAECLQRVLTRSPTLEALRLQAAAATERRNEMSARPDPQLSLSGENISVRVAEEYDRPEVETTISLLQNLEPFGQRHARIKAGIAGEEWAAAEERLRYQELREEVMYAFADALTAQERISLTTEAVQLAADVKDIAGKRLAGGKAAPQELDRAETGYALAVAALNRARRELTTARETLAALWQGEPAEFGELITPEMPSTISSTDLDLAQSVVKSPGHALLAAESAVRQAEALVARSEARPPVELELGLRKSSSERAWFAGVSIGLPFSGKGHAAARAATLEAEAALFSQRGALRRLLTEARARRESLLAAEADIAALRDTVLPAAERARAAAERSYREGKTGQFEVLEAARTLLEAQERLLTTENNWRKNHASLDRLSPPAN
ncbi:MAG: TolC family protein [Planctomycetes bacterium]|nr:TolC family protein [Planctomycetota bacterium]